VGKKDLRVLLKWSDSVTKKPWIPFDTEDLSDPLYNYYDPPPRDIAQLTRKDMDKFDNTRLKSEIKLMQYERSNLLENLENLAFLAKKFINDNNK
jgi:hypothetical protein